MKTITLAPREKCTACGACMQACPKGCIHMQRDLLDCEYPSINRELCVSCGKCEAACPAINICDFREIQKVYVAWNTNECVRFGAASGGIASAIYQYALSQNMKTFGVQYTTDGKAKYVEVRTEQDIVACRNSKYVFSDISEILKQIQTYLRQGETVILPALPCQIAAVLSYLGGRKERLILVDIVCHGICPTEYLNQHICKIEKKKKKKTDKLFFRDPEFGTHNYMFTLRQAGRLFYHADVNQGDTYQLGYHKSLIYRENCYHCRYATADRLGDLTIADFGAVGALKPFAGSNKSVSCVIVSSDTGAKLLESLKERGLVVCEERPKQEALNYERQLKAPSIPHKNRQIFEDCYKTNRQYDVAARKALKQDILKNNVRNALHLDQIRKYAAKLLSNKAKQFLNKLR